MLTHIKKRRTKPSVRRFYYLKLRIYQALITYRYCANAA
jgi:hypothetical protein